MKIKLLQETAVISSLTSHTVPPHAAWHILYGHCIMTTVAGGAARRLHMLVQDENGAIMSDAHAGATQAAGLERQYTFKIGIFRETSFIDADIEIPLAAKMVMLPGWTINFQEANGVDVANDSIAVNFVIVEGNLANILQTL